MPSVRDCIRIDKHYVEGDITHKKRELKKTVDAGAWDGRTVISQAQNSHTPLTFSIARPSKCIAGPGWIS